MATSVRGRDPPPHVLPTHRNRPTIDPSAHPRDGAGRQKRTPPPPKRGIPSRPHHHNATTGRLTCANALRSGWHVGRVARGVPESTHETPKSDRLRTPNRAFPQPPPRRSKSARHQPDPRPNTPNRAPMAREHETRPPKSARSEPETREIEPSQPHPGATQGRPGPKARIPSPRGPAGHADGALRRHSGADSRAPVTPNRIRPVRKPDPPHAQGNRHRSNQSCDPATVRGGGPSAHRALRSPKVIKRVEECTGPIRATRPRTPASTALRDWPGEDPPHHGLDARTGPMTPAPAAIPHRRRKDGPDTGINHEARPSQRRPVEPSWSRGRTGSPARFPPKPVRRADRGLNPHRDKAATTDPKRTPWPGKARRAAPARFHVVASRVGIR